MGIPLRVLIIEDSEDDTALVVRELRRGGYDVEYERVDSPDGLTEALSRKWNLIISDHSMPRFTGTEALKLVRKQGVDVPFIFISGTIGEETAVAALKLGAQDYLMKTNLSRLTSAVRRELREVEERRERESLEQQLHHLQRHESIGRLAGGVAHDFNNLMGVIAGYSEMLMDKLGADPKLSAHVTHILKATERGASLTRQLLAFSRKQVLEPRVINIQEHLRSIEGLLRRVLGEDIRLTVDAGEHAVHLRVRADPAQFEQVIMNLVVNARDAMPSGGSLNLEISQAHLDAEYCKHNPDTHPGSYMCLAVSDTGCGMSPEVLSRVFEPFFTTKESGKGTGLGLATVYGIVKQSGGNITVYSEVGNGTTFKIYLPLSQEYATKPEEMVLNAIVPNGKETILLVEDEDSLREVISDYLRNRGYTILVASEPESAIAAAESAAQSIDLLLTDVILPGSSGVQLAQRLTASHPKMRVLYVSGYTADAIVHHGGHDSSFAFLSKPFSLLTLAQKIRSILDEEQVLPIQAPAAPVRAPK
jgi:two-component system, cell cycle sensor histidine kinase and response regulator CckA